jgi:predicted AlkP superfamily pyrophosphatase or phosphodiesterase
MDIWRFWLGRSFWPEKALIRASGMKLLLISLDAVFEQDAELLLKLPVLGALAAQGVFCSRVQTVYPTLTYPVHTSILTGCYPERHQIAHNEPFQPDVAPEKRAWYWDSGFLPVDTLHTAAYAKGMDVASVLWPVTGKNHSIRRNFPEVKALPGENQTLKMLRYGSAGWIAWSELRYGKKRVSVSQPYLDDYATLLCETMIRCRTPDVLTLHLVDCDEMRHRYGTNSSEALAALKRLDALVGRLLGALADKNLMEDTIIAIVSDHGQADITSGVPLDDRLQAAGIPARAQSLGMGAYIHARPEDIPLVSRALAANAADWKIAHVYDDAELRSLRAAPSIHLAVDSFTGVAFEDHGETCLPQATHGFGIGHPGAQCLLWLSGRPFIKGYRLAGAHVTDIAPTLARALGLFLPAAQGVFLEDTFR